MRLWLRYLFILSLMCAVPACARWSDALVHKIDIQQGNLVTQAMVDDLAFGMTPRQVRYQLGSPLIADSFHPGRWDYFYSYAVDGKSIERRRLTLYFQDDKLQRIVGGLQPRKDRVASRASAVQEVSVTVPNELEDRGWLREFWESIWPSGKATGRLEPAAPAK